MATDSVSIALTGSGGAGVMTAGQILLDAAAKAGYYGLMSRTSGPQIRGGEAAALVRISTKPVSSLDDRYDLVVAFDWQNVQRFAAELPMGPDSLILTDPAEGEIPGAIAAYGARVAEVPFAELAKTIPGGRANMIGLGVVAALIGLPIQPIIDVMAPALKKKGEEALKASTAGLNLGAEKAAGIAPIAQLSAAVPSDVPHWNISGNEAAGLGAVRGGVRFCAAYPITPGTEILEWLAPNLAALGGALVQAEDEIASITMCLGASFGGVPSITATSGPGLSLMVEAMGLSVASETPVVIVDVMRGGPSTGIPTKCEQSDLNIAVYGLHGDAPHLVVAPNAIGDCVFSTQWAVHLAEHLQTCCIVLSDQYMGQSRAIIERPADLAFMARRLTATPVEGEAYQRYKLTANGISPMAIPGTPAGMYTADGLEHNERGTPSSSAADHQQQMDKRLRKLMQHDYGNHWADVQGEGEIAVITWGSVTGPCIEAVERVAAKGAKVKLISQRLLLPALPEKMAEELKGVTKLLVVEQTHDGQFHKYLRAHYQLPETVAVVNRPGPLPIRPHEVEAALAAWM
jgi:2-oxoglutarate ferredoxin oxidoreductase subunit alpha